MSSVDLAQLEQLRELLGSNFRKLIETFIDDNQMRVEQLEEAIRVKNWSNIRQLTHAMKSSSANIGALKLSEYCAQIERESENKVDDIEGKYDRLRSEFKAVVLTLKDE